MWFIFFLLCVSTLTSSVISETDNEQFKISSNAFTAELYQKTIEGKTGNVIISPISIQIAISLAMFGANGETKEQMLKGLKYPIGYDESNIAMQFEQLTESFRYTNGLQIANKIYTMKGFTAKQSFLEIAEQSFNSDAQDLDFKENTKSAAVINAWVEENTNNKIKDLVKPFSLNGDTRMVLVNAIHFKGFWTYPFQNNHHAPFYINADESVPFEFMIIENIFNFGEIHKLDATAVELPYKNSGISMLIIVPNNRSGLSELEAKLHTVDLTKTNLRREKVMVGLPKFKIECDIDLNESLEKMGMTSMFSDNADFSNLLQENEPLSVSKVIHKAFIEVYEKGTEAAAATAISMDGRSARQDFAFVVNSPFLFVLKDKFTRTILFQGRFVKPN